MFEVDRRNGYINDPWITIFQYCARGYVLCCSNLTEIELVEWWKRRSLKWSVFQAHIENKNDTVTRKLSIAVNNSAQKQHVDDKNKCISSTYISIKEILNLQKYMGEEERNKNFMWPKLLCWDNSSTASEFMYLEEYDDIHLARLC